MKASFSGKLKTTSAQARVGFGSDNNIVDGVREVFIILITAVYIELYQRTDFNRICIRTWFKETIDSRIVLNYPFRSLCS